MTRVRIDDMGIRLAAPLSVENYEDAGNEGANTKSRDQSSDVSRPHVANREQ